MTTTPTLDLVIKNARVVRPNRNSVDLLDIGVKDGKFARLAPDIRPEEAKSVFDAKNRSHSPAWWTRTCTPASTGRSPRTR